MPILKNKIAWGFGASLCLPSRFLCVVYVLVIFFVFPHFSFAYSMQTEPKCARFSVKNPYPVSESHAAPAEHSASRNPQEKASCFKLPIYLSSTRFPPPGYESGSKAGKNKDQNKVSAHQKYNFAF